MVSAVTYSTFRANLKSYMKQVSDDATTLLVTAKDPEHNIVVLSERDYDAMMETLRIYSNPQLHEKLKQGLAQIQQGAITQHELIED